MLLMADILRGIDSPLDEARERVYQHTQISQSSDRKSWTGENFPGLLEALALARGHGRYGRLAEAIGSRKHRRSAGCPQVTPALIGMELVHITYRAALNR
jgi:hypothetical protein